MLDDTLKYYSELFGITDFLSAVFGDYLSDVVNHKKPVVLYGAGSGGKDLFECLQMHKIDVACFCDKNQDLIGTTLFSIPVISFEALKALHRDSIIVVASINYKDEIKDKLEQYNFSSITYLNHASAQMVQLFLRVRI